MAPMACTLMLQQFGYALIISTQMLRRNSNILAATHATEHIQKDNSGEHTSKET